MGEKIITAILIIVIVLGILLAFLALGGLINWGIGAFIINVFKIDFAWTYWHGVALSLIEWSLAGIFKTTVSIRKD